MTNEEVIAKLDLGTLDSIEDLPRRLREVRRLHLEALNGRNPGLSQKAMERLYVTRRAEIAIAEEALRNMGEPLEEDTDA